jgi:hypothetical protein
MNFWYLPKGSEGDDIFTKAQSKEELLKNEKKIMNEQEMEDKDETVKEILKKVNETEPVPYTAGELIGLSRDIEEMIGDALGDVTKVKASKHMHI